MKPEIENPSTEHLEGRILTLARKVYFGEAMGELEAWYLAQVVDHCSKTMPDLYRRIDLDQVLRGVVPRPEAPGRRMAGEPHPERPPRRRVPRLPEVLRGLGDRCLYDVGMAGVREFQGVCLETLGVRSYRMAAEVLSILADEVELRELFHRNRLWSLPIEGEIAFLFQCASRFGLHARLLEKLREEGSPWQPGDPAGTDRRSEFPVVPREPWLTGPSSARPPGHGGPRPRRSPAQDRIRMSYERILLLAETDLEEVRRRLHLEVVGQEAAVDGICDDLLLYAAGTHEGIAGPAYLLLGPTGVGKRHLLRRLVHGLEEQWGMEIPWQVLHGPAPAIHQDDRERPFPSRPAREIDEMGFPPDFLAKSARSPFSLLIVDGLSASDDRFQRYLLALLRPESAAAPPSPERNLSGCVIGVVLDCDAPPSSSRPGGGDSSPGEPEEGTDPLTVLSPDLRSRLRVLRFSSLTRVAMNVLLDREIARAGAHLRSQYRLEVALTARARTRLLELGFRKRRGARDLAETVARHCIHEVVRRLPAGDSLLSSVPPSPRGESRSGSGRRQVRESPPRTGNARWRRRGGEGGRRVVIDERDGEFRYRGPEPG